jgi:hypothetical protein
MYQPCARPQLALNYLTRVIGVEPGLSLALDYLTREDVPCAAVTVEPLNKDTLSLIWRPSKALCLQLWRLQRSLELAEAWHNSV